MSQLSAATLSLKINLNNNKSMKGWGAGIKKALPYVGRAPLESYIYL